MEGKETIPICLSPTMWQALPYGILVNAYK